MADRFQNFAAAPASPATHAFTVTPVDNADLTEITRGLYVGGAGNLAVIMQSGAAVTFTATPAGSVLPLRVSRVMATGTTATSILGLC